MSKRLHEMTATAITRRIKQGRGQGEGTTYKPWLFVQDVPSTGWASRILGWKTGREHHLLSDHEFYYFLTLEWSPRVTDIREQFPLLPLQETIEIAEELGVRHPTHRSRDRRANLLTVMTTDFLLTCVGADGEEHLQARTVKPTNKLGCSSVISKFEVERRYWQERSIEWRVVTEHEINWVLARNVELFHSYRTIADRLPFGEAEIDDIASVLTEMVQQSDRTPLRRVTSACDKRLGLEPRSSLTVAYYLLANRVWQIDMNVPLSPSRPLGLRRVEADWLEGRSAGAQHSDLHSPSESKGVA